MKTKKISEGMEKFVERMNEVKEYADDEHVFFGLYNDCEHISVGIGTPDEIDLISTFAFVLNRYLYNESGKQEARLVEAFINGLIAVLSEPTPESLKLSMQIIKPIIKGLQDEMKELGISYEKHDDVFERHIRDGMMNAKKKDLN